MHQPKSFFRLFFDRSGWGALLCGLFLLSSVFVTANAVGTAYRLQAEGESQTATITAMMVNPPWEGPRRWDRHWVSYSFVVGQTTHQGQESVSRDFFRSHSVGDRVPVRYWTLDPNLSEVELGEAAFVSKAGFVICLVAALSAFGLGRHAWRYAVEAAWMARNGERHPAWILDHVQTSPILFGSPLWRATWQAPDGTVGVSQGRRKSALPAIGREVTILVDPERRRPSRLEADLCHTPRPPR